MNNILNHADVYDSLHSTPKYTDSGYPMLRAADIKNNFITDELLKDCVKVSYEDFLKHNKNHQPKKGDIIITRVGVNLGKVAYINSNQKFCLGQNIAIISPFNENRYLYYYLKSPLVQNKIYSKISGSAYKLIGLTEIKNIDVELPNEYKEIGEFLFNIEYKIQLNNKIINEINNQFKSVYNYYFNQFACSNVNRNYDYNIEKEIPENWDVISIEKLCKFVKGVEPGTENYNESKSDELVPFYRVSDMNNDTCLYVDKTFLNDANCQYGDLMVSFDGTVGKVAVDLKGVYSTGMKKITPYNELYKGIVYMLFNEQDIQSIIRKYSTGSIIKHASSSIKHIYIPYNKDIYNEISEFVNPLYFKIVELSKENINLNKILNDYTLLFAENKIKFNENIGE